MQRQCGDSAETVRDNGDIMLPGTMGCGSSTQVDNSGHGGQNGYTGANGHAGRTRGGTPTPAQYNDPADQRVSPEPRTPTPAPRTPTPAPRTPTPAPRTPSPVLVDNPTPPPRTPSAGSNTQEEQEDKDKENGEEVKNEEEEVKDPGSEEGEQQKEDPDPIAATVTQDVQDEETGEQKEDEEDPLNGPDVDEPQSLQEKERTLPAVPDEPEDEDMDEDEETQVTEREAAREVIMGRQVTYLDSRSESTPAEKAERPSVESGELYTDPDFGFEAAMEGLAPEAEWKRPKEFRDEPVLYAEGTTRFDVGQGSAGTCYFLSILSSIADKPEILNQVIPKDAYTLGTDEYDGIFHCRFWRFGEWLDVYIDDCLPVVFGKQAWGAQSSTDPNEMWVSLMEKAFARFIGSYKQAEGGWAGDAFTALTGGTVERIDMKETSRAQLFDRISKALVAGSVVSCSVPGELDGQKGLVGGHAYTLTGATSVSYKGKKMPLVRIRNPWGTEKGEWKGAWSDGAAEWKDVNENAVDKLGNRVQNEGKGDGEFWMSLADFFTYFASSSICNFVPDFDKDGVPDGLTQLSVMFGEWKGESAAGCDAANKFRNQKFMFTVPGEEAIPVVLQFMREQTHRREANECYIRLDCYKVEAAKSSDRDYCVLDEITNNMTFQGGSNVSYRYLMEPGRYLILPTTMEAGVERQFCVRLFAAVDIPCSTQDTIPGIFIRKEETKFEHNGVQHNCCNMSTVFGEWKEGVNAGGQIANRSFPDNPQYLLDIQGADSVPLFVSLKQVNEEPRLALGFKIYPVDENTTVPLDLRAAWNQSNSCVQDVGGAGVFVIAYEGAANHIVTPGRYVLIPFTDKPGNEKQFALTLATSDGSTISVQEFNTA